MEELKSPVQGREKATFWKGKPATKYSQNLMFGGVIPIRGAACIPYLKTDFQ